MTASHSQAARMEASDLPEMSLSVVDGRGVVSLAPKTLFGWLHVDRLELEIPAGGGPIEPGDPAERYQRRRCLVTGASLAVDEAGLGAMASAARAELARA